MDPNIITEKRVFNAETKKENSELIRVLGLYEAGLIRSTEDGHIQVYNKKKNTWENTRQYLFENGYIRIRLYRGTYAYEHDAVYIASTGVIPGELDHKDKNKTNNKIENLEVVSHGENLRRRAPFTKKNFVKEDFDELLEDLKAGVKKVIAVCEMAAKYNCCAQTIRNWARKLGVYWVDPVTA